MPEFIKDLTPRVKNVGLAFAAGFITTFAGLVVFTDSTDLPAVKAAFLAALWAGFRGATGKAKEEITGEPFSVDTEAG